MESNLLEIKRFLEDHKVFILTGSIIVSVLFALSLFFLDSLKEDVMKDSQEDFEPQTEEILNDAQPAYFQFYLEQEDGTPYGNSAIFNYYFNLASIKEEAQKATGIDIKSVEDEVYSNELYEEMTVINLLRNDSSYVFTASFNLGNERNNLIMAEYYYDLLFSNGFSLLQDKKTYIFEEPMIVKRTDLELTSAELRKEKSLEESSTLGEVITHARNGVIGLLIGVVAMIGLALLKELFGEKLNYSFAYDLEEEDKFILYDAKLKNENLISQFIAAPFGHHKVILSEQKLDGERLKLLAQNKEVSFANQENEKILLTEMESLAEINTVNNISEAIIVICPQVTTRKWYKLQKQFAKINQLPTKIIQMNPSE